MTPTELFKESIKRAVMAPGNIIAGVSAAGLTAAASFNPLPLIFYAVGSLIWTWHAVSNHRYDEEIMAKENQAKENQTENAQAHLQQEVRSLFGRTVVQKLMSRGFLPNYMATYDELVVIRDEAAEIARTRKDVANTIEEEIINKLDQMLAGFLRLARARVMYSHVLFGVYGDTSVAEPEEYDGEKRQPRKRLRDTFIVPKPQEQPRRRSSRPSSSYSDQEFKDLDTRIAELTGKIEVLQEQAVANPNVAQIQLGRIDMLKKRIELLRRSSEQDQRVAAQLDAMPDAFRYILDSVRATQFTADQVTGFMSSVIGEVDETIRFVEAVGLDSYPELNMLQFPNQQQSQG